MQILDSYVEQTLARHRELICAAEEQSRVLEALAGAPVRPTLRGRALARLGQRLVEWGWSLQERDGTEGMPSAGPAARGAWRYASGHGNESGPC